MKNSPAVRGFVISLVTALAAFGIYFAFLAKKNDFLADNPSNKTYYFRINEGSENIIAPGQTVKVALHEGRNHIKVFDEHKTMVFDSAFTVRKLRGLLNIPHADYYIHTQYYGYNLNKDSLMGALKKTKIDGVYYYGAPVRFNKLYTEDFYYNINEEYDPLIKNVQQIESRTKIFRKEDFLHYYKNYYKSQQ